MLTNAPLDMEFVRAQFPGLNNGWVFFDNAGGSQILKGAVERINAFLYERNVQIGGSYEVSQKAAEALLASREAGRLLVNAERAEEIVFGHSTTVLTQNLANAMRSQLAPGDEIVVTVADHESNIGPWERLREFGIVVKIWPLDLGSLKLRLADLEPLMSERTRLVCVHHVSNILGEINPVREIADFVHARGARICVDAVAYAPHRAVDVRAFGADYYIFSLYKTYGPHLAMMYGRYDHLLELDTLYHYFYGRDRVPGKLEAGKPVLRACLFAHRNCRIPSGTRSPQRRRGRCIAAPVRRGRVCSDHSPGKHACRPVARLGEGPGRRACRGSGTERWRCDAHSHDLLYRRRLGSGRPVAGDRSRAYRHPPRRLPLAPPGGIPRACRDRRSAAGFDGPLQHA